LPKLIVFPGSTDQFEVDLRGREALALGRDPACDVVVPRRMASRQHAVIEHRSGRFYIRDQDSYNNTFVNNRAVREAELIHGDEIRIADRLLRFVEFEGGPATFEAAETLPHPAPELEAEDLDALGEVDTPPALPVAAALPAPALAAAAQGTAMLGVQELAGSLRAAPVEAAPAKVLAANPRPFAPRTVPAGAPRGRRRGRLWMVLVAAILTAAGLTRLYLKGQAGEFDDRDAGQTPEPDPGLPALESALELSGDERIDRLWAYLQDYPQSRHRETAYLRLLEAGATELAVCEYAERQDPPLFIEGSPLRNRCVHP